MAFGEQWKAARQAGYTPDQIVEHLKSNPAYAEPVNQALAAGYKPAEIGLHLMGKTSTGAEPSVGTTGENVMAGTGYGITRAYGQAADKALGAASSMPFVSTAKSFGVDPVGSARAALQQKLDEQKMGAAPLLATKAGRVGNIAGTVAAALPTAFIPGANTYAGAALVGGATGAGLSEERTAQGMAQDAAIGATAGTAAKYIGGKIGEGAAYLKDRIAAAAAKRAQEAAQRQGAVAAAKGAGYVIPPTSANPGVINRTIEGLAGKLTTAQKASVKNQEVTNRLIRQSLSIPDDVPINVDTLKLIRSDAGKAYEAVRGAGPITADSGYAQSLDDLVKQYQGAAKEFPELAKNDVEGLVNSVRQPTFSADSAVSAIRILRDKADAAYASGNKELGKAAKGAAEAMEGLVERNLAASNQANLLSGFRNARQTIAKTYTVEKALNGQTGNVNALKLAQQLAKGRPLSGDIKKVAEFGTAFPKAAQEIKDSVPGLSPLDFYGAGGIAAATQQPAALALLAARPAARSLILSNQYQARMLTPNVNGAGSSTVNALADLANSQLLRAATPGVSSAMQSQLRR